MHRKIRVLSIDGGGIRGIIPALVLTRLEALSGKPISQLFDLIAGTSSGGIIALGLTVPGIGNVPQYSAQDAVDLFEDHARDVFKRSTLDTITTIDGLLDEKYRKDGIEKVLNKYFGSVKLSQALTPVLVPAYETSQRTAYFFKSEKACTNPDKDLEMKLVARATSAAPTYFEPALINKSDGQKQTFIDGALYANNPALCAFVEAKTMFPEMQDICVVSLGTGSYTRPYPFEKIKDWGKVNWAEPVLDMVFDGIADSVDYQLKHLLPTIEGINQYHRFQLTLAPDIHGIDRVDKEYVDRLKQMANKMIDERAQELERVIEHLHT